MTWAKRIFLFIALNFVIMMTLTTILSLLNVQPFLTSRGLDLGSLAIFCLIWGMGGAFISLFLSKTIAKFMMGVQIVDPETRDPALRHLLETVHRLSRSAGLREMPEVGIYHAAEMNAFATGPSRSRALVAVSSGLMQKMSPSALEGVLGHEIAHIANGDMVMMTLIQGVVNAFVMFLARVLAFFAVRLMNRSNDSRNEGGIGSYFVYHLFVFVFQLLFMVLGSLIVAWFSRQREFRADAGGAEYAGREKMIEALEALRHNVAPSEQQMKREEAIAALKISHPSKSVWRFWATHPPLEERIARLRGC